MSSVRLMGLAAVLAVAGATRPAARQDAANAAANCINDMTTCFGTNPGSDSCLDARQSTSCCSVISRFERCIRPIFNENLCEGTIYSDAQDNVMELIELCNDFPVIPSGDVLLYPGVFLPEGELLLGSCADTAPACRSATPRDCSGGRGTPECCDPARQQLICYRNAFSSSACTDTARELFSEVEEQATAKVENTFCTVPPPTNSPKPASSAEPTTPAISPSAKPTIDSTPTGQPSATPSTGPSATPSPAVDPTVNCLLAKTNCRNLSDDADNEFLATCESAERLADCVALIDENECLGLEELTEDFKDEARNFIADQNCGNGVCFPSTAMVELKTGETKAVSELTTGEEVKVGPGQFSPVYFFSHASPNSRHVFVRIETEKDGEISLTASHYIYVEGALRAAKTVQAGERIHRGDGERSVVKAVTMVSKRGLYNPHTVDGNVVVDGFQTSTYTTAVEPKLAQVLLTPIRWLYQRWGVSMGGMLDFGGPRLIVEALPRGASR